ncbi:MAG: hypothetical protein HY292_11090 [Planctomycetes bacterium]|nr:hypothetical protein [Planctomycetota bacterium]
MTTRSVLAVLFGAAVGCSASRHVSYEPREGDVVFQSLPRCDLVDAIEGATKSPFSHCGLVVGRGDGFAVLEAFHDVHETPLDEWVGRGRERAVAAFRLREEWSTRIPAFVSEAHRFLGKPYDVHYAFDDDAIYCSELIYKAFKAATGESLGSTQRLSELNWPPFEKLIHQLEGPAVPLDREMITPQALADATQLHEIYRSCW